MAKPISSFKAGWNKATGAVGKRVVPGLAVGFAADAVRKGRYGDAVGEAAWLTVPTGVMYEAAAYGVEANRGKPIPKGAQARFGLGPNGKPRGRK